MRLFAKLFLCATLVISIALLLSGYLLITFSHESAVEREAERAINQFQYDKFIVQASVISSSTYYAVFNRLSSELGGLFAFFDADKQILYSDLPPQTDFSLLSDVRSDARVKQFQTVGDASYIMVSGMIELSDITLYVLIATDISTVIAQREYIMQSFVQIYFITLAVSIVIILILSALITKPIKKMNRAAAEIAKGRYNERLPALSNDEIGELSNSFNLMAAAIEDKIHELVENARQKEDFVANFAHELKTPLTSVIGYADMIYQKPLPPEKVKDAAWYILNEGLRLEALSLKLMDLIVLNRQDFVLEEMNAQELLENIAGSLKPMLEDKKVSLRLNIQPAYIKVEYDLFKTLMFNLIDNAVKAGCKKIDISTKQSGKFYSIGVSDNGRGMPVEELTRITEAFYTVDKSRSRTQHGAGIGLALAARIAEIHGSTLKFNSAEGVGTVAEISVICGGGEFDEQSN